MEKESIEKYQKEADNCKKTSITMALCTGVAAISAICIANGCLDEVFKGRMEVITASLLTLTPAVAATYGACSTTRALTKRKTLLKVISNENKRIK